MTTVLTNNANYTAIANAIRTQLGVQTTYMPSEMAAAIASIEGGGGGGGVVDPDYTYYNGYLLPTIPVVSGYSYVWVRRNEQTGNYDAVYGNSQWYANYTNEATLDTWNLGYNGMTAGSYKFFECSMNNPSSWIENTGTSYAGFGTNNNRDIIWTSHDILIDSVNGNVLLKAGLSVPYYTQSALGTKAITTNGTYNASDDNLDGFSVVTVNVSDGLPSLPSGYRQVEYIEMTPNSYATIGNRELTTDDNILLRYKRASDSGSSSQSFFCMETHFTFYFSSSNASISPYGKCYKVTSRSDKIIDGLYQFYGAVNETLQGNVYIGCYDRTSEFFKGKAGIIAVYTQIGTFAYDYSIFLIPCVRTSDDAVGFYDAIGEVFYTNQGSGSFTAGPYVV